MIKNRSALIFVVFNLVITLPLAAILNIWIDEAYTLGTTDLGAIYAWTEAIQFENQPPLYFVLLSLWRQLSDSIFFARFFSCLCIALTVFCGPLLSRRYLPNLHPRWLTLAIAINPYTVWAALEIRTYALGILLSALLLVTFCDAYLVERPIKASRYGYGILAIAALYTNYLLGSLLIAQWVTLVVLRRRRESWAHLGMMMLVGVAFLPMLWPLADQVMSQTSALGPQQSSFLGTFKSVMGRVLLFAIPSEFDWGWVSLWDLLRYGALGLGVGLGLRQWRVWREESVAIASFFATTFFVLTLVLDITDHAKVVERYGYPLFLVTLLLMFSLLSLLREHRRQVWIWSLVTCGFCVLSLVQTYAPLAKDGGDWRRLAVYLETHETVNQPIAVFSAEGVLPLKYHYHGVNTLFPLPSVPADSSYNLHNLVLKDERDIAAVLMDAGTALQEATSGPTPIVPLPRAEHRGALAEMETRHAGLFVDPTRLPEEFWLIEAPLHMVVAIEKDKAPESGPDVSDALVTAGFESDIGAGEVSVGEAGVGEAGVSEAQRPRERDAAHGERRCEIWNIDLNCQVLDRFVATHYDVVEHVGFYDAHLKRLRRKPLFLSGDFLEKSSLEEQGLRIESIQVN